MDLIHHPRKKRPIRIRVRARGAVRCSRPQIGCVEDLSEAGLYFSCPAALALDTEVTVIFDLPTDDGDRRVWVRAVVRHRERKHGRTSGMGLQFLRLPFEHAELIRAFVRKHEREPVEEWVVIELAA